MAHGVALARRHLSARSRHMRFIATAHVSFGGRRGGQAFMLKDVLRRGGRHRLSWPRHVRRHDFELAGSGPLARQLLLGSGNRVLIVVEQLLNTQRHLHVAFAIGTLTGAILLRREHRELRFPIPEHVRLYARQLADLTDLEEQFFWNRNGRTVTHLKPRRGIYRHIGTLIRRKTGLYSARTSRDALSCRHVTRA